MRATNRHQHRSGACHLLQKEQTMLIASSIAFVRRYARYRSQLASISQLDERSLRDIGIRRGELATAAWRHSAHQQYP
jgi:uncharacterized protein YjiS (DUF1127 family)